MPEIISATKALKALNETSELLFIPATIAAVWAQFGSLISGIAFGSKILTLVLCSIAGILGSIGLYQLLGEINLRIKFTSFFAIASGVLIASGLLVLFPESLSFKFYELHPFSGIALITWGFMLEAVRERIYKSHNKAAQPGCS